jgi:hypothetical protein
VFASAAVRKEINASPHFLRLQIQNGIGEFGMYTSQENKMIEKRAGSTSENDSCNICCHLEITPALTYT